MRFSDVFQRAITLEAGGGEFRELTEECGIDFAEIKTGFALHAFLQFGRDAFLHGGMNVHRHEVVADVALAHPNGGKPERLAPVNGLVGNECVEFWLVREHLKMFFVRLENLLERGEHRCKVLGRLGSSSFL